MYNASRASRPIRALNGDFSFNARVLTNRAALASRPFVVVADRFDSKGTGESVGGCCSPTNWFGRSLAWARLRTRVNTNTPCMCASAASTFTRFFCAQPRPQHACLHRLSSCRGNYIELDSGSENWEELDGVIQICAC